MQGERLPFFVLMAFGVILEVAGDVFFKKWSLAGGRAWLVVGFGLYSMGAIGWALSLKHEGLAKAVTIFMVANVALALVAGLVLFGEKLNVWNWIGVGLALAAIVLCEI
jgi:multidrug transporter EmrE-like cation transporter